MIGFPIDSHVEFNPDGSPYYDRAITSEPYRKLLKQLFKTGVMPNPSSNMQVTTGEDMNVVVQPGFAMVEGCMKLEEEERTLALQASDNTYDRIDTVVLRLDDNDDMRICDFYIVTGTPSASPVRPELTREGSIYEIGLADIFVTKRATLITAQKITDTRYEEERCGVVSSISEFDTTFIYDQVQNDLKDFKKEEQEEFVAWFQTIRGILDEEAAGHLQNEIDSVSSNIGSLSEEIEQINNDLKEIYKEMYIPMVNRYSGSKSISSGKTDSIIISFPKVDLSHTQIDIESASAYLNTSKFYNPLYQDSALSIKSVSETETETIVTLLARNGTSQLVDFVCTIRVTEYKKPTD